MNKASFEDFELYNETYLHTLNLYAATAKLPKSEIDGICANLRKAAINVPSNIAKAFVIQITDEKIRFYEIAKSHLIEIAFLLSLLSDLSLGSQNTLLSTTHKLIGLVDIQLKTILVEIKNH